MNPTFIAVLALALPAQAPAPRPAAPRLNEAPWLTSLAEGTEQARRRQQPVFVRVGGAGCVWCKKLEEEIRRPAVQRELGRWTLVALDADRDAAAARSLSVGAIPALRVLTPTGRVVASSEGYVSAERLVAWLREHYDAASGAAAEEFAEGGELTADVLAKLVAALRHRDPALREAAVRRLLPRPELAAKPVAEELARGPLQGRLAAVELLREWQAPVADVDPWRPETLTEARLKDVRAWAAAAKPRAAAAAKPLTPDQLTAARLDLDRLVQVPDTEAAATRERLARLGPALLPEVYARLKQPPTDQARERLTALRYRLVAGDALALSWPGGLDRLASSDPANRHRAIQELAARATAAEEPLLLELFSNPDPLVRELSLKALQLSAGPRAAAALTRLLQDPEPNVRAAVLKQLGEQPAADMVPKLTEYAAAEPDPDLVVHAVRALRAVGNDAAFESLKKLTAHASWRVRAEAAQAIGECVAKGGFSAACKAQANQTLMAVLKDADGFVVSRAVAAFKKADYAPAVAPLVEVVKAHPQLGVEVIATLSYGSSGRQQAVPHLRQFCKHERPEIRAAALAALCTADSSGVEAELRAGLKDPAARVRIAAGTSLLQLLDNHRPGDDTLLEHLAPAPPPPPPPPAGLLGGLSRLLGGVAQAPAPAMAERPKHDPDVALKRAREGEGRADWMKALADLLPPLLTAPAPEERLAGALPLVAFGREDQALPVLLETARAAPGLRGKAAAALGWLPWDKRIPLYRQLLELKPTDEQLEDVVRALSRVRDPRVMPLLWELAAREHMPGDLAEALLRGLSIVQFGNGFYHRTNGRRQAKPDDRAAAAAAARPKAARGPEAQRVIALAWLTAFDAAAANETAGQVLADDQAPPGLRRDAFQVRLIALPRSERRAAAVAALAHAAGSVRQAAALYLTTEDPNQLRWLRDRHVSLDLETEENYRPGLGESMVQPFVPDPPKGLTPEQVRPLLRDADPQTAAAAGFLLVLLGQPDGLPVLLAYWREHAPKDPTWVRLVCRAVAALDDDGQVRLLDEVYRGHLSDGFTVRELYWTTRRLEGPAALKLRKLIRKEAGRDELGLTGP